LHFHLIVLLFSLIFDPCFKLLHGLFVCYTKTSQQLTQVSAGTEHQLLSNGNNELTDLLNTQNNQSKYVTGNWQTTTGEL